MSTQAVVDSNMDSYALHYQKNLVIKVNEHEATYQGGARGKEVMNLTEAMKIAILSLPRLRLILKRVSTERTVRHIMIQVVTTT